MSLNVYQALLLPLGLGMIGFIEPCTIGGHLVFLNTLAGRSARIKTASVAIFTVIRTLTAGLFGALVALLGGVLIGAQSGLWIIFGGVYLALGLAYLVGRAGMFKRRVEFAPARWKASQNSAALGLVFGLNIPACAAPIIFLLIGMATTAGSVMTGFATMAVFGFALSSPLILVVGVPRFAGWLEAANQQLRRRGWLFGMIFVLLGLWSIWFGIFVDIADWTG